MSAVLDLPLHVGMSYFDSDFQGDFIETPTEYNSVMNADLSNIIEEALRYASPLPVSSQVSQLSDEADHDDPMTRVTILEMISTPICTDSNIDSSQDSSYCANNASDLSKTNTGSQIESINTFHSPSYATDEVSNMNQSAGHDSYQSYIDLLQNRVTVASSRPLDSIKVQSKASTFATYTKQSIPQGECTFQYGHDKDEQVFTADVSLERESISTYTAHTLVNENHMPQVDIGNNLDLGEDVTLCKSDELENESLISKLSCEPVDISDIHSSLTNLQKDSSPTDTSILLATPIPEIKTKVKRKRNRQSNPDRTPVVPVLPPCRICDDKSSGFHYGANTCEACKGFFRRTLKKKVVNFQCKCQDFEKLAWKRGPFKNGCPACRYERCLAEGMSKNAIKIGRYTLDRKTDNIKEVKSLEAMDMLIEDAIANASDSAAVSSSPMSDTSYLGPGLSSPDDFSSSVSPAPSLKKRKTGNYGKPEETLYGTHITLKEIDSIVKVMDEAQKQFTVGDCALSTEIIAQKQTEFLEKYKLRTELFGHLPILSKEEYIDFYNVTGIDLDGRKEQLDEAMVFFEKKIEMIVEFAKAIPGFQCLCLEDQGQLIKASRIESLLVGHYKAARKRINLELRVCTTPWGRTIHLDEIGKIVPKELLTQRFMAMLQLAKLDLTGQEDAIVRAIVIMFVDRCNLKDVKAAEEIQEKLLFCLEHLLDIRPGGHGNLLHKIFDILISFRDLTDFDNRVTKDLLIEWPDIANKGILKVMSHIKTPDDY